MREREVFQRDGRRADARVDRLAALVPPPRVHHHRYFGVLAPNSPLRAAVTARAPAAAPTPPTPPPEPPAAEPAHHRAARNAWAMLLARIYEVFRLACSRCGAQMRIIAFITDPSTLHGLLRHLGEPTAPPRIAPALGPPLWDLSDATTGDCDPHAQPAPAYEFDQRVAWYPRPSTAVCARRRAGACPRPPARAANRLTLA
ncbi:MAG: transposase [Betaproteobacteria bacterium]|nr:transposase [Betaproteobacteria bacterium]